MQPDHPRHASHVVLKQEVGQKRYVLFRVHASEAERRDALEVLHGLPVYSMEPRSVVCMSHVLGQHNADYCEGRMGQRPERNDIIRFARPAYLPASESFRKIYWWVAWMYSLVPTRNVVSVVCSSLTKAGRYEYRQQV
jgi:hypothetical protein